MATIDKIDALGKPEATKTPTFDNTLVTVIFVLGGPGAGKGTQCTRLVDEFQFVHLSGKLSLLWCDRFQGKFWTAGDLLRAEQHREGSQFGTLIQTCIREGTIVPMEVTIKLLENAMTSAMNDGRIGDGWSGGQGRFLVDGFPRKMDQALKFDEEVCLSSLVLFFSTTEEVMLNRILERGKTSGREDDNVESLKKRFRTYESDTMPVIEHYVALGKVAKIDSSGTVDAVEEVAKSVVYKLFSTSKQRGN